MTFRDVLQGVIRPVSEATTMFGPVGREFELLYPPSDEDKFVGLHPRWGDNTEFKAGDKLYLKTAIDDSDGFYWVTLVKDKRLLDLMTMSGRQKDAVTFTPSRLRDLFNVLREVGHADESVAVGKTFIGTCVDNPFETDEDLGDIIDDAVEISRKRFLTDVDVDDRVRRNMMQYPHDYEFYMSEGGSVYFFTHSAIHHFFK